MERDMLMFRNCNWKNRVASGFKLYRNSQEVLIRVFNSSDIYVWYIYKNINLIQRRVLYWPLSLWIKLKMPSLPRTLGEIRGKEKREGGGGGGERHHQLKMPSLPRAMGEIREKEKRGGGGWGGVERWQARWKKEEGRHEDNEEKESPLQESVVAFYPSVL